MTGLMDHTLQYLVTLSVNLVPIGRMTLFKYHALIDRVVLYGLTPITFPGKFNTYKTYRAVLGLHHLLNYHEARRCPLMCDQHELNSLIRNRLISRLSCRH